MRNIIPHLLLIGTVLTAAAEETDAKGREPFALYRITPETSRATRFQYKKLLSRTPGEDYVSGFYSGPAVLEFAEVSSFKSDVMEMKNTPISGISFAFSERGLQLLQTYVNRPNSYDVVAIIDGRAYASVSKQTLKGITEKHSSLFIAFPPEPANDHLIQLLVEKLSALRPR